MRAGDDAARSAKRPSAEASSAAGGPGTITVRSAPTEQVVTSGANAAAPEVPGAAQSSWPSDRPGSSAQREGPAVAVPSITRASSDRSTWTTAQSSQWNLLGNIQNSRAP